MSTIPFNAVLAGQSEAKRRLFAIGSVAGVILISIIVNYRIGTISDVSWIITLIERLIGGDRLYLDVMETNPPFTIWLYYPVVYLANKITFSPELAVAIYVYLISLGALALTMLVVRRTAPFESGTPWWFWPFLAALFLILPGNAFAQREHIGLMLFFPLIILQAWRLSQDDQESTPKLLAVVVGLCASVMILVKPHWAIAVLLPALYIAWKKRSVLSVFTVENFTIGIVATAYLGCVLYWHPEFLNVVYPMLELVYLPVRNGAEQMPQIVIMFAILMLPFVVLRWRHRGVVPLADIAAISAIGFFISMVVLGKGWGYHRYPYTVLAVVASIVAFDRARQLNPGTRIVYDLGAFMVATTLIVGTITYHWRIGPDQSLVDLLRSHHERPKVAVMSSDLGLGFPLARRVGGVWISFYNADWAGAHALMRLRQESTTLTAAEKTWLEAFLSDFVAEKTAEFTEQKPDLVFEDKTGGWSRYLRTSENFAAVMADYKKIAENSDIVIWSRRDELVSNDASGSQ